MDVNPVKYDFIVQKYHAVTRTFYLSVDSVYTDLRTYTATFTLQDSQGDKLDKSTIVTLGNSGLIQFVIPYSLTNTAETYDYDFYIKSAGGDRTKLLYGKFVVESAISEVS